MAFDAISDLIRKAKAFLNSFSCFGVIGVPSLKFIKIIIDFLFDPVQGYRKFLALPPGRNQLCAAVKANWRAPSMSA
jgi:hypothetical protein